MAEALTSNDIQRWPEQKLRGHKIPGYRYTSREFFEKEWEHMWTKVWLLLGRESEMPNPGDWQREDVGPESILMVRQKDGSVKAFYNICQHRGQPLVSAEKGSVKRFVCPYHSWAFMPDGTLNFAPDSDDFPEGNPCGKVTLVELPCETFAGFVWVNMDPDCVSLKEYLGPIWDDWSRNFGKALAAQCDVYVNDAFAVSHRVNASVVSITRYAPVSVAGLLLKKELDYIEKSMADPVRPLVAVVGGAKISSKLTALENMMQHVDKILIGGAMANTFLKYNGCEIGKSMIEEDLVETAGRILKQAAERKIKFYIPVDAVVADRFEADAAHRRVPVQEIGREWMVMDIGPATAVLYGEAIQDAGTAIWNGPMGVFEMAAFSEGTRAVAHAMAGLQGTSIVGGGETGSAVHQAGVTEKITYVSTGGGAFLCLLEGKSLPAVAALESAETASGS